MKRAREAEEEKARRNELEDNVNPVELISKLKTLLQQGETAMQAIQRRNARLPIKKIGQRQKSITLHTPEQLASHAKARQEIEEITELATKLIGFGHLDIYDTSRESL